MNFNCDKSILQQAALTVSKIIPSKAAIPAIEGILFNVYDDGKLKLTGFDLEVGIETYIEAEVHSPGSFIVNAKLFGDILRSLTNDTVSLSLDDKLNLTVFCGVIKFVLPCMESDSFPNLPLVENEKQFTLQKKILHSMIRQTIFAVATNDIRTILKGILFDIDGNTLSLVSSDYNRLAIRKEAFEKIFENNLKFIVPGKALNELIKIMDEDEEDILIGLSAHHVTFEFDSVRIVSRLIEGEFLNYKSIIPTSYKTEAKVNLHDMKLAVERASLLLDEKTKNPVRLSIEYDSIVVSCRKAEGHSFTDEIGTEKAGDSLEIGFNNKYLLGVLAACESEEIILKLNSPLSSMSITNTEDDKFFYLISPMRLRNEGYY